MEPLKKSNHRLHRGVDRIRNRFWGRGGEGRGGEGEGRGRGGEGRGARKATKMGVSENRLP